MQTDDESTRGTASDYVERTRDEILEISERSDAADVKPSTAVYVFFSFDLVNSTLYKTIRPADWPVVTTKFYDFVKDDIEKLIAGVNVWKHVGDELLLFKRIDTVEHLLGCVSQAHNVLIRVVEKVRETFEHTRTILSVKGTVWCARVHMLEPHDLHVVQSSNGGENIRNYSNIAIEQPQSDGPAQVDFLGSEIDTGFRIAKYAAKRRLVVSAEMAYLTSKFEPDTASNIRVVAYEPLKGVWGNRRYPICWYEPSWDASDLRFEYDERFDNPIVRSIVDGNPLETVSQISRVFQDLARDSTLRELEESIAYKSPDAAASSSSIVRSSVRASAGSVHCVALCFRDDGRILVAKRPDEKRRFKGHWELGCGQLAPFETFAMCLKRAYLRDFGVTLAVPDEPIPIGSYVIDDASDKRMVPGIVFLAEVPEADAVKSLKHSDVRWIEPTDEAIFELGESVPNLARTVKRGVEARSGAIS